MGEENKNVKKPAVSNTESFCVEKVIASRTKTPRFSMVEMLLKRLNGLF